MTGKIKTNRVAVHISGMTVDKMQKLLGIPEVKSGTGEAESRIVMETMATWSIKEQIVALVFDTTATNSSGEVGACYHLEFWVNRPILWTACRHHMYELHVGRVVEAIWGVTTEPGMAIFRRLRSSWHSLNINYGNLEKFDYDAAPDWMVVEARSVLKWAH